MLLYRSASVLHFERLASPSKLLFSFRNYNNLVPNSSSPCSVRIGLFCLKQPCYKQSMAIGTVASSASASEETGRDTFYAVEGVSWTSLGVSDNVSRALVSGGIQRPSLIQAACIPSIMSGNDVVIAAETGSGKTHGYLVPLINKICSEQSDNKLTGDGDDQALSSFNKLSLVLCPNVMLCEQVVQMANRLCDENGKPLLRVAAVCGRQGWPVYEPDIIVSTPAALLNYIEPNRSRRTDFLHAVKHVVFDEVDMLLVGSFQNKVIRLMNLLRFQEKLLSRSNEPPEKLIELESDPSSPLISEDENDLRTETVSEDEDEDEEEDSYEVVVDANNIEEKTECVSVRAKDWRRVRKTYERSKQYIFVAATLPVNGKKTAGAVLRKLFPDACWVSGKFLHCHSPRLEQRWIEVTVDNQVDELIKAVNQGYKSQLMDYDGGAIRTMVFANTVETVEAVANILMTAGIQCFRYHKNCTLEERSKTLDDFRQKGGVFVCTDAAARGVDIPNVSHVIQAEFATSAVDFLHRIGRTGRAGQYGLVTSMYTEANRDLVAAIQRAKNLSQPVEAAFSRKRSFRNKLKKQGSLKVSALA